MAVYDKGVGKAGSADVCTMSDILLPASWFRRPTATVAADLLGCRLVRRGPDDRTVDVRIVETEAYLAEGDEACHAARRRTPRNAPMFEAGGILYVYMIYGIHRCANIVTEQAGRGCAVLLRAAEVEPAIPPRTAAGPGLLARHVGLDLGDNGVAVGGGCVDLVEDAATAVYRQRGRVTTRIGITRSVDLPLRFYVDGHPAVSRRPGRP